ncbi:MAG: hypothetical protein PHF87_10160 [Desulfotomaculaceae bacterium]|nr:hypothetical protein [Desulfotomaculaceae bacterium]
MKDILNNYSFAMVIVTEYELIENLVASRRYQKRHRNRLWHSDTIDDATRFVLHGEFYPTLDQVSVKRSTNMRCPEAVYFDNGSQYRTKWMQRTCSKLGTRLVFAKPKSPEATGKVERFNRGSRRFFK